MTMASQEGCMRSQRRKAYGLFGPVSGIRNTSLCEECHIYGGSGLTAAAHWAVVLAGSRVCFGGRVERESTELVGSRASYFRRTEFPWKTGVLMIRILQVYCEN